MLRLADCRSILVDRVSHRGASTPAWPCWEWSRCGSPVPGWKMPVSPAPWSRRRWSRCLKSTRNAGAVCVTSPTYYGVCSDLTAIGAVCRRRGSEAVGGRRPRRPPVPCWRQGENPYAAADLVTVSAHKTPGRAGPVRPALRPGGLHGPAAPGQPAVCHLSPSYPMMAALDALRPWLAAEGTGHINGQRRW